ncbi:hypothetical protein HDU93_005447 [Gonapodya sp. JEL0774]|nr:hypothetical protein HDU93_005447 [Gonapodya sp. JEL0774]
MLSLEQQSGQSIAGAFEDLDAPGPSGSSIVPASNASLNRGLRVLDSSDADIFMRVFEEQQAFIVDLQKSDVIRKAEIDNQAQQIAALMSRIEVLEAKNGKTLPDPKPKAQPPRGISGAQSNRKAKATRIAIAPYVPRSTVSESVRYFIIGGSQELSDHGYN